MFEPVVILPHGTLTHKPHLEAKQALFDCGNGYGLSMVWAKGARFEHGLYCSNEGRQTYEIMLIEIVSENGQYDWDFIKDWRNNSRGSVEPKGWQSIEDVGETLKSVAEHGLDGWDCWIQPFNENED